MIKLLKKSFIIKKFNAVLWKLILIKKIIKKQSNKIIKTKLFNNLCYFLKKNWGSLIIFSLWIFFFSQTPTIYYKNINKYVILLALVYTLVSTFLFLKKSYNFGKYTSQIQRFWKRSYMLFWLIEGFLFVFFIYLLFTHYTESNYFLDYKPLIRSNMSVNNYFFLIIFLNIFLISISYLSLFFLKNKKYSALKINFFFINCLMLYFLFIEFSKFFYTVNYYYSTKKFYFIMDDRTFSFIVKPKDVLNKTRTALHYTSLIIFLKFWHLVFIYYFNVFCSASVLKSPSMDVISSNLVNFMFLLLFNLMLYIFLLKSYVMFYFTEIYYWFFINKDLNTNPVKEVFLILKSLLFSISTC